MNASIRGVLFVKGDRINERVDDMAKMLRFYRDVLGFEIKETEAAS